MHKPSSSWRECIFLVDDAQGFLIDKQMSALDPDRVFTKVCAFVGPHP